MSTLKNEDFKKMEKQLEEAKGKMIPKDKVLSIIQEKLKEADSKNDFIVDRIDGVALKELINIIAQIQC
ncbi:MAG: hypothetical protein WAT16_05010 [Saprospiraceae bacterium]|nr:hypothetical protein [Saprospiraceae bacterium]